MHMKKTNDQNFLAEPVKADVEAGKLSDAEARRVQAKINQRIETGRQAIA